MNQTEPKSKQTLREEEHERRIKQNRLSYLSTRIPDRRVIQYPGIGPKRRPA
jgi:hypothetical protein